MRRFLVTALVIGATSLAAAPGDQLVSGRQTEDPRQLAEERLAVERILRATDRIIFDRLYISGPAWRPLGSPPPGASRGAIPRRTPDEQELLDAVRSPSWRVRAAVTRAIGRLETPADVGLLATMLVDSQDEVRLEASNALAQVLRDPEVPGASQHTFDAVNTLLAAVAVERSPSVVKRLLVNLGELRMTTQDARRVEQVFQGHLAILTNPAGAEADRLEGALEGLEEFVRHNPGFRLSTETIRLVRGYANANRYGLRAAPALEVLALIGDADLVVVQVALAYQCAAGRAECGSNIRQLGLRALRYPRLNLESQVTARLNDPAAIVRLEALHTFDRDPDAARTCWPILGALTDRNALVVMEALSLLRPTCRERDEASRRIEEIARVLLEPERPDAWRLPAAALTALAKFDAATAARIAHEAVPHKVWQVRAAIPAVAVAARDEKLALALVRDEEANVRTEVLKALHQLGSRHLRTAVADALDASEHQLLLVAAALLKIDLQGAALIPRAAAALQRLNHARNPTSRETRLEILARLAQFGASPEIVVTVLDPMLRDPDPAVAIEAGRTIGAITGAQGRPRLELPSPTLSTAVDPLGLLDNCYQVTLSNGRGFQLKTDGAEAPYAADLFHALVLRGYYNGLTIHRVMPLSFAEGGSPAANYYSGAAALRDEVGLRRARAGAVGLSRHDRHTGNMQFFVMLGKSPELDRQFSMFGSLGCGPGFGDASVEWVPGLTMRDVRFVGKRR